MSTRQLNVKKRYLTNKSQGTFTEFLRRYEYEGKKCDFRSEKHMKRWFERITEKRHLIPDSQKKIIV